MTETTEATVLEAHVDDFHVLRYIGAIRYPIAPAVARFIDGVFARTETPTFVIDLTGATSIDSTNLGTIARIAIRARDRGLGRPTILSNRSDIGAVLTSMGFDEVFAIVETSEEPSGDARPLAGDAPGERALRQTTLDAHRALMELNERNRVEFRDVVALLEREEHAAPRRTH